MPFLRIKEPYYRRTLQKKSIGKIDKAVEQKRAQNTDINNAAFLHLRVARDNMIITLKLDIENKAER